MDIKQCKYKMVEIAIQILLCIKYLWHFGASVKMEERNGERKDENWKVGWKKRNEREENEGKTLYVCFRHKIDYVVYDINYELGKFEHQILLVGKS